jgi:DNA topoisomerase-1
LVKQLEELGIGRPSTYAPTISTIQNRNYVEKGTHEGDERAYKQLVFQNQKISDKILSEKVGSNKGKLVPTDIGIIVTDFLVNHFESILDYNFTAKVEESFDDIAEGKEDWRAMMKDFYKGFHPQVEDVQENAERESGERILGVDPKTGRQVSVRLGKFGPMVQIGTAEEEEKPKFASLSPDQQLNSITFEEAMDLFKLPKSLGHYNDDEVEVNNGRFGPYVRYGEKFVSLPKGVDPLSVELDEAILYIKEKELADAPIYMYQDLEVTKGKGRFGPFIKWNNMFINVNKKYDWDNLSEEDIVTLIEEKIQKEIDKVIHNWEDEGIRVEKARWGRHNIIKGKQKVELAKTVDVSKITLEKAQEMLEKNAPKKKATKKKATKKKASTKKK